MRVRTFAIAVLLAAAAPAAARAQATDARRLRWEGGERTYTVRAPAHFDRSRPAPVIILLHGRGGSGARFLERSGFAATADSEGLVLVAPDGTGDPRGWYTGFASSGGPIDDVGFIGAIIDSVVRRDGADPRRVYLVGYSNGGALAHRVASDLSSRIAAAAVFAGAIGARTEREANRIETPRAPVPMLIIHGDADPIVRYEGGRPIPARDGARFWARANECRSIEPRRDTLAGGGVIRDTWDEGCRAPVRFLTLRGGDHGWPAKTRGAAIDAAETIWEFFEETRRR
jgi:polyhydroxybutyrate depolymerase